MSTMVSAKRKMAESSSSDAECSIMESMRHPNNSSSRTTVAEAQTMNPLNAKVSRTTALESPRQASLSFLVSAVESCFSATAIVAPRTLIETRLEEHEFNINSTALCFDPNARKYTPHFTNDVLASIASDSDTDSHSTTPSSDLSTNSVPPASNSTKCTTASTCAETKMQHPFEFLSLPRELRDHIYSECLIHHGAISIQQPRFHLAVRSSPTFPLSIARANKQLYSEAMEIFFSENNFILELNVLSACDWLASLKVSPTRGNLNLTLGRLLMMGRDEIGYFDSPPLRSDLVKRLVYDLSMDTISVQVPDEQRLAALFVNANGVTTGINQILSVNNPSLTSLPPPPPMPLSFALPPPPRYAGSWALTRDLLDTLLESGFSTLRLVYSHPLPTNNPASILNLYALSRLLYLDDEYGINTQVERIDTARLAGRRPEFSSRGDIETFVRRRRHMRRFSVMYGEPQDFETGAVVVIKRVGEGAGRDIQDWIKAEWSGRLGLGY